MKNLSKAAVTIAMAALAQSANAGLLNDQVSVKYYYPDLDTVHLDMGSGTVDADGVQFFYYFDTFVINVTNTKISVDYGDNGAGWVPAQFSGFALTNHNKNLPQFTIDSATNMIGFGASNVSVLNNVLYVNWQNLDFNGNTQVVLNLQEAQSEVPEPMSLGLFGLGLAGLGLAKRRRRA